jgi:hypothetical protein
LATAVLEDENCVVLIKHCGHTFTGVQSFKTISTHIQGSHRVLEVPVGQFQLTWLGLQRFEVDLLGCMDDVVGILVNR